ncbi:BEL1-like homeodomain protein 8 [Apostasia shenzhenica]|uniref:BEL1-like homeodomain protein 8 n=1 Tax=Apostasia shenzhenica TaxID=1088818 RepID=A0A2H9ZS30_9ASPA|nr:BEL1-like homeodomain protein 8 [Apostasia shenzhenica]
MSSAAGRYVGGGEESVFLPSFHHHETQHGAAFHVPQHSRREKLRFPAEDPPATAMATSSLPLLYQAASSPCSLSFYSQNPSDGMGMAHLADGSCSLTQIQPQQGFSLTLSPPPAAVAVPLGPFTGYSAVLNRSRFLEPARQLLEEICDLGRAGAGAGAGDPPEMLSIDREMEGLARVSSSVGAEEQQWKKARLISLLNEVCRRYRLYYQQVQTVITSFEAVPGLNTAAPYVCMALKSMWKHFRFLKNAISNQLHRINKALGKEGIDGEGIFGFVSSSSCLQEGRNSSSSSRHQHVWRPQRGLPERAVSVLRAWLFEHFLHPYPTDADKQMLAKQTGLTRNQVSNWFINARVRLWKPMVEEVHNLEMLQVHNDTTHDKGEKQDKLSAASQPSSSTATSSSNPQPQTGRIQRNGVSTSRPLMMNAHHLSCIPHHVEDPYNFVYNDVSGHGSGVSLTLGLHQNTTGSICLSEPLPMNVARRFGLEDCNDSYVIGALEGHVGKDIGGHLLRDFVG